MNNKIRDLIENGFESANLDFKEKMYPANGTPDLLKDILAMANSNHENEKYIIMGVKDDLTKGRIISGIAKEQIVDSSNYQQFILNNIEPDLDFNLHYVDYKNKQIALIEISNSIDKPYMTKKQYKNLNQGLILIRKGSTNSIATRADLNRMYQQKSGKFEIRILDSRLRAVKPKDGTALIDVSLRNLTSNPITIVAGILYIRDNNNNNVNTRHPVYGFESEMGADFRLEIPPKKEFTGDIHVGFGSNDCLRLNLDQFGYTDERFIFDLNFRDSYGNEYQTSINDGFIFARGEFLWKVKKEIGLMSSHT